MHPSFNPIATAGPARQAVASLQSDSMDPTANPPSTETLWTEFSDELRAFLLSRTGDRTTADDLLQEVYLRIHRGLGRLTARQHLRGWVYRIARNLLSDHHRARSRQTAEALPANDADDGSNLNEVVGGWLRRMIDELPANYREAMRLSELEELPQARIAHRLGITLTAAKSRIQRGRRLLKERVEACCALQFDRRGNVIDYTRRRSRCEGCGD